MSSDAAYEQVEHLEKRVAELQIALSSLQDNVNTLKNVAIYTYGALVELYVNEERGANDAEYRAALEKIGAALDRAFGLTKPDDAS